MFIIKKCKLSLGLLLKRPSKRIMFNTKINTINIIVLPLIFHTFVDSLYTTAKKHIKNNIFKELTIFFAEMKSIFFINLVTTRLTIMTIKNNTVLTGLLNISLATFPIFSCTIPIYYYTNTIY